MFDLQFPIFNTDYELYLRFPLYILDNKPTQYISLVVTLSNSESSYIMSKVELMEICDECAIPTPEWCYLDDVTLVYIYINWLKNEVEVEDYPFLAKVYICTEISL